MNYQGIIESWAKRIGWAGAGAGIIGLLLLSGECKDFRETGKDASVAVVAPPTKAEQQAEAIVLPCRDVQAIEPGKRERQRIAERYARPDLAAPEPARTEAVRNSTESAPVATDASNGFGLRLQDAILGERELPKLPEGGRALITMTPAGHVDLTIAPNPPKLWDFRTTWEFGGLYGIGTGGDTRGRAWVGAEPVRFGRLHLRAEAGVDLRAGQTDGYGMVGITWRSR